MEGGDGAVLVEQVGHDLFQGALPLAGGAGTGTRVGPVLARLLVVGLLRVQHGRQAARRGVLARKQHRAGHFLHGQIPNVPCQKKAKAFQPIVAPRSSRHSQWRGPDQKRTVFKMSMSNSIAY